MNKPVKIYLIILLSFTISSCSNLAQKNPDNKPIRLIQKDEFNIISNGKNPDCRYLGEVIGSEGHCTLICLSAIEN
jgi:hypothetical protein